MALIIADTIRDDKLTVECGRQTPEGKEPVNVFRISVMRPNGVGFACPDSLSLHLTDKQVKSLLEQCARIYGEVVDRESAEQDKSTEERINTLFANHPWGI